MSSSSSKGFSGAAAEAVPFVAWVEGAASVSLAAALGSVAFPVDAIECVACAWESIVGPAISHSVSGSNLERS